MNIDNLNKTICNEFDAIEELESHPERGAEKIQRAMDFEKTISNYHGPEYTKLFYNLFKKKCKCKILRFILRKDFTKRPNAEEFLIAQLNIEEDPIMQAEILQLLGHMKSIHTVTIAHDYLKHQNQAHREVALFVLGWLGTEGDIPLLREHLLNEEDPHLRITAASAHRQIAWHFKDLKDAVLQSLKVGFEHEQDDEVLSWIIAMLGTVAVKNLGIREDKDEPDILHGDLEKAKVKTRKFLETI